MFVIQLLKIKGCKHIIAIDADASKLELARSSGADYAFTPGDVSLPGTMRSLTASRGADIAIEVVGINDSINTAIDIVRKGGTIVLIGNVSPVVELPLQKIVTRQIRLQGSCAINGEYTEVLQLAAEGKLDMRSILSAESPLQEGGEWFRRLYNKEKGLMKVILKP
jgi:L-iditol 2-dehydrogenase